jgi:hypothetical protein
MSGSRELVSSSPTKNDLIADKIPIVFYHFSGSSVGCDVGVDVVFGVAIAQTVNIKPVPKITPI